MARSAAKELGRPGKQPWCRAQSPCWSRALAAGQLSRGPASGRPRTGRRRAEKSSAIYVSYLAATDRLGDATLKLETSLWANALIKKLQSEDENEYDEVPPEPSQAEDLAAQREYEKQRTLVYVYGSSEAWAVVADLDEALEPLSVEEIQKSLDGQSRGPTDRIDPWFAAYARFGAVLCKEAPATPRDNCEALLVPQVRATEVPR